MSLLLISDELVRRSITPSECVAAVERGFVQRARGQIKDAQAHLAYDEWAGGAHLYGAHVTGVGLGAKVLTAHEQNAETGVQYIFGTTLFLDLETGRPQAILNGSYLTALRTAAATALGARHLARGDSRVLGIIGTGLQARTHLLCHLVVHPFEKVLAWGRNPERLKSYIAEMSPQIPIPIVPCPSADVVVSSSDVVTCTTRADAPVFSATAVRPGTHIGIAGPFRDNRSEAPLSLVQSALVFVDSADEFKSLWPSGKHPPVAAELGQVMLGEAAGRRHLEDITLFKPVGLAFEDVVSAKIVIDNVLRSGEGVTIDW